MTKSYPTAVFAAFAAIATLIAGSGLSFATASSPDTISVIEDTVPATDGVPPQPTAVSPVETSDPSTVSATGDNITPLPNETVPVLPDAATAAAPVPQDGLTPPAPTPSGPETGVATGGNVLGDTGVESQHSGQYYDADALVPDSDLAKAGVSGPQKVDPLYEPGQKFVVVERGAGATSFEGQYVAATRALKLGRYAAAMEMFEKLYKKNHRDPRILMGLAVAQQGAGFVESAARTYEDLLDVEPSNADAVVNLMGIMQAQYPSVTLQNLMELRDKYPTNPGIPAQIGLVNAQMSNYDDAMRYLEIAASMDPRNPSHIYNMAIIMDRKGDTRNAIPLYERALQLDASYGDTARALNREEIYDRLSTLRRKA